MNSACLSIKFKPLVKTVHQKSFCCLEIVPEISGLDTLEAVSWKNDILEYNIPMVYKVVLKRRRSKVKNNEDGPETDTLKTYHSCVDLLNTGSALEATYFQGDCSKNISDSFIFGKLLSDIQNFSMFLRKLDNGNSLTPLGDKHKSVHSFTKNARNSSKIAQTTNVIELHDVATEDSVVDRKPEVISIANNADITRLSVTPICSLNTNTLSDKQLHISAGTHNYLMMFEPSVLSTSAQKYTEHGDDYYNTIKYVLKGYDLPKSEKSSMKLKSKANTSMFTTQQALAQCRITQFRMLMKEEIMPLNEILDKLIEKCVCLGFKKPSVESDAPAWKLRSCRSGSNRVVYNIVSEG